MTVEEAGESDLLPARRREAVFLGVELDHRQSAALRRQRVESAGELLLLDQEGGAGRLPLVRRDDRWPVH